MKKETHELPVVKTGSVREVKQGEKLSLRDRWKLNTSASTSYLVTMLFSNGTCKQFVINTTEETFLYKKRMYNLFYENAYYDLSFKQYRLFFFDDHSIPLEREIKKSGDKSWWSVRPNNLKPLLQMEYVKTLAQSHEISRYLKMSLMLCAINLFILIIMGVMLYQKLK